MKTVGIIGTHGKTSVAHILEDIFLKCGKNVGTIGDLGTRINKNKLTENSIEESVIQMRDNGVEYLFLELNERTKSLDFSFDCILLVALNDELRRDELLEFYRGIVEKTSVIIINSDVSGYLKIIEGISDLYTITFGLNNKSTATASAISAVDEKMKFNYYLQRGLSSRSGETIEVQEIPIEVNLVGYQNIYNSIAAITTGLIYDLGVDEMVDALYDITPVPNRLELLKYNRVMVLLDNARDGYSFKMLLESLQYLNFSGLNLAIEIKNLESIIKTSSIEDFTKNFYLLKGCKVVIIGGTNEKILDRSSEKILVDRIVNSQISLENCDAPEVLLNKYMSEFNAGQLLVWIGEKRRHLEKLYKKS